MQVPQARACGASEPLAVRRTDMGSVLSFLSGVQGREMGISGQIWDTKPKMGQPGEP